MQKNKYEKEEEEKLRVSIIDEEDMKRGIEKFRKLGISIEEEVLARKLGVSIKEEQEEKAKGKDERNLERCDMNKDSITFKKERISTTYSRLLG
ncbi:unnamed protein product [Dovyalis caffra]|uniref:Uncharacterized protein n=1 Tax=Dovyalis caffra TaxID=77055 RepID=A0AAV1R607_9ROSI|nr:unnamed protein product [Dovyalis caffra]